MSDYAIKVEGLLEFQRGLKRLDREAPKALRKGLNQGVELVVEAAKLKVVVRSGRAKSTIRARSTQTAARIAAGGAKARYYPWLDFGGRVGRKRSVVRRFYTEGRYIYPSLAEKREEMLSIIEHLIIELGSESGLEVENG